MPESVATISTVRAKPPTSFLSMPTVVSTLGVGICNFLALITCCNALPKHAQYPAENNCSGFTPVFFVPPSSVGSAISNSKGLFLTITFPSRPPVETAVVL